MKIKNEIIDCSEEELKSLINDLSSDSRTTYDSAVEKILKLINMWSIKLTVTGKSVTDKMKTCRATNYFDRISGFRWFHTKFYDKIVSVTQDENGELILVLDSPEPPTEHIRFSVLFDENYLHKQMLAKKEYVTDMLKRSIKSAEEDIERFKTDIKFYENLEEL